VDGVPYLVTHQPQTPSLLDELFRYQRFFDRLRKGQYEPERVATKIEFIKALVRDLRAYFESIVGELDLTKSPLILDTGAGMMETSLELARRGGRVIATDFSPFELRNPRIYSFFDDNDFDWTTYSICDGARPLRDDEITFARVLASTERLPFLEDTFDIVFTRSSLHHLKDIKAGLAEMTRVLKPGGTLAIAGECIRPPWESEQDYLDGVLDFQEGIDEQMRTWGEYAKAMKRTGLKRMRVVPIHASGGKRWLRFLERRGWRDPFRLLEGVGLRGPARGLLHAMGCVVGWTAVKTGPSPPRESLPEELTPPLAEQVARFPEYCENLKHLARRRHQALPSSFGADSLPRPACYGFGALESKQGCRLRRIYREAVLLFGRPSGERRWTLSIWNQGDRPSDVVLSWRGEKDSQMSVRLMPGKTDLDLDLPSGWSDPVTELVLTTDGSPVDFSFLHVK